MVLLFSLALLFTNIWASVSASECDSFMYGILCPTDHLSNIIWTIPDLENEIKCQVECVETSGCQYFMFVEFTTGTTECFLLRSCDSNSTSACSNEPDCQMAVSGPVTPSLVDSCCDEFEEVQCDSKYEVGHEFDVFGEQACQQLCRDELSCSYWTLFGDVCFFYSSCGTPTSCSSCTSGPAFPDMSTCASHQVQYTLLLGGDTPDNDYSKTLEMITPNLVCSPNMPALPVERIYAKAALLGSTIFYCGGQDAGTPSYHMTCHSYLLGKESARWEEEASMNYARDNFGLTTIGDRLYATGGSGVSSSSRTSVESFSHETGWVIEDTMELPSSRYGHCSVALGSRLVVVGGRVGGSAESSSVQAFDTSSQALNTTASWVSLASMNSAREFLACNTGDFEKTFGIYVTGGQNTAVLNTVEFYSPVTDTWTNLASLGTARYWHSLTKVNGQMVVAGGVTEITSVETLNGTEWIQTNNLKAGRGRHTAVSVPAGLLTCQMEAV